MDRNSSLRLPVVSVLLITLNPMKALFPALRVLSGHRLRRQHQHDRICRRARPLVCARDHCATTGSWSIRSGFSTPSPVPQPKPCRAANQAHGCRRYPGKGQCGVRARRMPVAAHSMRPAQTCGCGIGTTDSPTAKRPRCSVHCYGALSSFTAALQAQP
jgi:hypothetical protein